MAVAYSQIMIRCAAEHGVTVDDILSRSTRVDVVAARYAALAECCRSYPDLSRHRLASWFSKDPTWTYHALRRLDGATARAA